jgi:hypothetical protein
MGCIIPWQQAVRASLPMAIHVRTERNWFKKKAEGCGFPPAYVKEVFLFKGVSRPMEATARVKRVLLRGETSIIELNNFN